MTACSTLRVSFFKATRRHLQYVLDVGFYTYRTPGVKRYEDVRPPSPGPESPVRARHRPLPRPGDRHRCDDAWPRRLALVPAAGARPGRGPPGGHPGAHLSR